MAYKSLSSLQKGERAVIKSILNGESSLRLMEIGLVPGVELELLAISPFGDPIAIKLADFSLSLRLSDANQIQVEII